MQHSITSIAFITITITPTIKFSSTLLMQQLLSDNNNNNNNMAST